MRGQNTDAMTPPKWDPESENPEHVTIIQSYKVVPCMEYRNGECCKGRHCFNYHNDGEMRRPIIDNGQVLYWDALCQFIERGQPCPYGYGCGFAHTEDERNYHPGQFKASLCKSKDYPMGWEATSKKDRRSNAYKYQFKAPQPQQCVPCEPPMDAGMQAGPYKFRFCAYYPNVEQCRRKDFCSFAHSREEIRAPLLSVKEESKRDLSNPFFTDRFKIHWCPIGVQHDWQTCVYAHNYQDARRDPNIGYGPRPCPYWEKKDRAPSYESRCPNGFRCPYAHGAKEQLYHPGYFKTVVCWDFNQGNKGCPRGNLCAFYHKKKLQRKTMDDVTDYNNPLPDEQMQRLQMNFKSPPFFSGDDKDALAMGLGPSRRTRNEQQWAAPMQVSPVFVPNDQWGYDGGGSPMHGQNFDAGTPMMMQGHPNNSMMYLPNSPGQFDQPGPPSPMSLHGSPMQGHSSPNGMAMGMLMPVFPASMDDQMRQGAFCPAVQQAYPSMEPPQMGMFSLMPVDNLPGPPQLSLPALADEKESPEKPPLKTVLSMSTNDGSSNGVSQSDSEDNTQKQERSNFDFHNTTVPFFVDDE